MTSADADQKGGWGHDGDAAPGVQVGEVRVAGNDQLGHGGIGQGKKYIVFWVRAVADNLRDIKQCGVITKAGNKGFSLCSRQVVVEFGAPQYRFQFLQRGMADTDFELQQRLFKCQRRNGLRANGGADQYARIQYDAPSEVHGQSG